IIRSGSVAALATAAAWASTAAWLSGVPATASSAASPVGRTLGAASPSHSSTRGSDAFRPSTTYWPDLNSNGSLSGTTRMMTRPGATSTRLDTVALYSAAMQSSEFPETNQALRGAPRSWDRRDLLVPG